MPDGNHNLGNEFLLNLAPEALEALSAELRTVEVCHGTRLFEMGDDIHSIAFPHSGTLVSIVVSLCHGQTVEAGMVGYRGVVGSSAIMNGQKALSTALVQVPGHLSMAPRERVLELSTRDPGFRAKIGRHEQFLYVQAQQAAACNAVHDIQARLARWLLHARDMIDSNVLQLTQEYLATLLGVQRTSVTVAARHLQSAELIRYRRGRIQLVDIQGLEECACECRNAVRAECQRLLVDNDGSSFPEPAITVKFDQSARIKCDVA
jgi:CRP-like cAMP-binding protein